MSEDEQRALAAAFDPSRLDPAFYANPYPTYARCASTMPGASLSGRQLVSHAAMPISIASTATAAFQLRQEAAFAPKYGVGSPLYEHHTTSLVFNDPPYHTRVRRQIVGALTPRVHRGMEPGLAALVERLLDRWRRAARSI